MKRLLLSFFLLVFLPLTARAESSHPALWVVKDADTTIYLFGTIHVLPPGVSWLDGPVKKAFDSADTLVTEVVMPDDAAALQPAMLALGFTPGLPPLKERIAPEYQAKLSARARSLGLPMPFLDSAETWVAALALTSAQITSLGLDPSEGVEAKLTVAARTAGKRLQGLETVEEQLRIFDALPEADQRTLLTSTLDEMDEVATKMGKIVADWKAGRAEAIAAETDDSLRATPRLAKLLLADRNQRWAAWIAERMAKPGVVFVAVGAGHLAGRDSVQAMLAQHGLQAMRLP